MKRRVLALLTLLMVLVCGAAMAETHHHTLHHWEYDADGVHITRCPECKRYFEVYCTPVTVEGISGMVMPYCPVCGDIDEATLTIPELTEENGASVVRHSFTNGGTAVLRTGELWDGSLLVSFCFEKYGSMASSKASVTLKLPSGLLDGYTLRNAAGVSISDLQIEGNSIRLTMANAPAALLVFGK